MAEPQAVRAVREAKMVRVRVVGVHATQTNPHKKPVDYIGNSERELGHVLTDIDAHGETTRAPGHAMTETLEQLKL